MRLNFRDGQNSKPMADTPATRLLIACMALIFAGVAAYCGQEIYTFETQGLRAEGKVLSLKEEYSSSGTHNRGYTYYPIVSYRTQDGRAVTFRDNIGSNPPSYDVGETVTVLYLEGELSKKSMIDRGWINWIFPGVFGLAAAGLFWLLLYRLRKSEKPPAPLAY